MYSSCIISFCVLLCVLFDVKGGDSKIKIGGLKFVYGQPATSGGIDIYIGTKCRESFKVRVSFVIVNT